MKQAPKIYRGIEYCVLRDLPADQQDRLKQSVIEFIKILFEDGSMLDNCIQYKDYIFWYDTVMTEIPAGNEMQSVAKQSAIVSQGSRP